MGPIIQILTLYTCLHWLSSTTLLFIVIVLIIHGNSLMNSSAQYLSVYTLYSVTLVTLIGWFQIRDSSAAQQWCFVCFFNLPLASGPNSLPKVPRGRFRENSQFFWTDPLVLYFRKILIYSRTFFFFGPLFIYFSGTFFFFYL